ncbi:hypothetical protein L1887_45700 [Cichorium endivia]|nr:hypothetical protein L1887_45700 [Cichorium endivia]
MPDVAFVHRGDGQRHQREEQRTVGRFAGTDTSHQREVGAKGNHRTKQGQIEQCANVADGPLWREAVASEQGNAAHYQRAVEHRPGVGGHGFKTPALMAHADHIAQREAVGAERGKTNPGQERRAPAAGQQIVPEEGDDPSQAQSRRRPETRGRALPEENKAVNGVIEHGHGEDHRLQPGIDMCRCRIKTPEVKAENAASLEHTKEVIPQRQRAQAAQGD